MPFRTHSRLLIIVILAAFFLQISSKKSNADGLLVKKRSYHGSLEEASQEAIILFEPMGQTGQAIENLILSIEVLGQAPEFAWVIPFPNPPETFAADDRLFQELFDYVETQRQFHSSQKSAKQTLGSAGANDSVQLISRNIVGNYEVAVVREETAGGLNPWLIENGYQPLENAEDVLTFYRQRDYVYACIKYSRDALADAKTIRSHPLRFQFATGGRDGIYFPMKLTGLQKAPFDVTLYVFTPSWLNDQLNQFGFVHRGFSMTYRDWDTADCQPNAGKLYSSPWQDPFLKPAADKLERTSELFQALHPGRRFYLTRLQASQLNPTQVRAWSDDLWLFPHYRDRTFVPFDARQGGVASAAWPQALADPVTNHNHPGFANAKNPTLRSLQLLAIVAIFIAMLVSLPLLLRKMLIR